MPEILATWNVRGGVRVKQHLSEPRKGAVTIMEKRGHADRFVCTPLRSTCERAVSGHSSFADYLGSRSWQVQESAAQPSGGPGHHRARSGGEGCRRRRIASASACVRIGGDGRRRRQGGGREQATDNLSRRRGRQGGRGAGHPRVRHPDGSSGRRRPDDRGQGCVLHRPSVLGGRKADHRKHLSPNSQTRSRPSCTFSTCTASAPSIGGPICRRSRSQTSPTRVTRARMRARPNATRTASLFRARPKSRARS